MNANRFWAWGLMLVLPAGHAASAASAPDGAYAPLWAYDGKWQITRKDAPPGSKPDELVNQCALVGRYFTCQQSVNGSPSQLLIFIPAGMPGHYYTQTVRPDGIAGGRGDLEISGDQWVLSNRWDQGGGKATYYRTTNVFTGKNKIHFEQAESTNNRDWSVKNSGDEVRVGKAAH
jgi:hypothetical protein